MRVTFQADADLDGRILRGLRRIAPEIDIRTSAEAGSLVLEDREVLRIAADSGRVLVSRTGARCPRTSPTSLPLRTKPGVILLREAIFIATAIEELVLIWSASEAEEWIGRLVWIPL